MKISRNRHIPPEAVLKWVIRQRDELAEKLEQLIGYTKALEVRNSELQEENEEYRRAMKKIRELSEE